MNASFPFLSGHITLSVRLTPFPEFPQQDLAAGLTMPFTVPSFSRIESLCSHPCLRAGLGEPRLPQVSYLPSPCLHCHSRKMGRITVHSPRVMVLVSKDSVIAKCQVCACPLASAQ